MPPASHTLVAAIRRGDEGAFAQFYELWFERAVGAVRKLTKRDESFCLDVVQDCMMKVVKRLPKLRDERAVEAWMARTLCSTAIDRLRTEQRHRRHERALASERDESDRREPADILSHSEQLEWIRDRLDELPTQQRKLILDRFADDGTLDKAGAKLGLSAFAVHGRIRRILDRWRARAAD